MRVTITSSEPVVPFMRRAGYGFQKEARGEVAFVRRVSGGLFPRYHAYAKEAASHQLPAARRREIQINLHIDQKAPTYGTHAVHSGEYEGPLVEQELARLREIAKTNTEGQRNSDIEKRDSEMRRKGFWGRLFG